MFEKEINTYENLLKINRQKVTDRMAVHLHRAVVWPLRQDWLRRRTSTSRMDATTCPTPIVRCKLRHYYWRVKLLWLDKINGGPRKRVAIIFCRYCIEYCYLSKNLYTFAIGWSWSIQRHFLILRSVMLYSCSWKPRKFSKRTRLLHSGSHAYSVGCYPYICSQGFS